MTYEEYVEATKNCTWRMSRESWEYEYGEGAATRQLEFYKKYKAEEIEKQKKAGTYVPPKTKEQIQQEHEEWLKTVDVPDAMDDTAALVLYIFVMAGATIFNDRIGIWILATIIFLRHKFRRQLHDAKWDREHKKGE